MKKRKNRRKRNNHLFPLLDTFKNTLLHNNYMDYISENEKAKPTESLKEDIGKIIHAITHPVETMKKIVKFYVEGFRKFYNTIRHPLETTRKIGRRCRKGFRKFYNTIRHPVATIIKTKEDAVLREQESKENGQKNQPECKKPFESVNSVDFKKTSRELSEKIKKADAKKEVKGTQKALLKKK